MFSSHQRSSAVRMLPKIGTMPLAFCHLHLAFVFNFSLGGQKKNARWLQVALSYMLVGKFCTKKWWVFLKSPFQYKRSFPETPKGPSVISRTLYNIESFTTQRETCQKWCRWVSNHLVPQPPSANATYATWPALRTDLDSLKTKDHRLSCHG